MFSKNPNRGSALIMKANANVGKSPFQPTTQQLYEMLQKASERIVDLEGRLQQIERGFFVAPGGDIEICSATQIRIIAGVKVEIQGDHSVDILGNQEVKLRDQNGNSIRLGTSGIVNTTSASFQTNASTIQSSAGSMTVSAGMSNFSGTVKCDTMIANSVIGSSYTPGAGNIW